MKRFLLLLCCFAIICAFSACSQNTQESSSAAGASNSGPSEEVAIIDDISSNLDYVAITEDVGPIAAVVQWTTPEEIPVTELLGWYLRYYSATNAAEDDPLAAYRQEDTDTLLVAASDFEKAAGEFFGLGTEYLQSDPTVYDAEKKGYLAPTDLLKANASCVVRKVDIAGKNVLVSFDLVSSFEGSKSYQLIINTSDGIQFKSCSAISDGINEKAPDSSTEGQISQAVPEGGNTGSSTSESSGAASGETE